MLCLVKVIAAFLLLMVCAGCDLPQRVRFALEEMEDNRTIQIAVAPCYGGRALPASYWAGKVFTIHYNMRNNHIAHIHQFVLIKTNEYGATLVDGYGARAVPQLIVSFGVVNDQVRVALEIIESRQIRDRWSNRVSLERVTVAHGSARGIARDYWENLSPQERGISLRRLFDAAFSTMCVTQQPGGYR